MKFVTTPENKATGNSKKSIQLEYFASLREQRGRSAETITTEATTPRELYEELKDRHGFDLPSSSLRVAVNDEFSEWETKLRPADRVSFLPPVSGG